MTEEAGEEKRTPLGISLLCLLLLLYAFFWMLAWMLSRGSPVLEVIAVPIIVGLLLLAYLLYAGNRTGLWIAMVVLGGSTLWRFSLVVAGETGNLSNALVGVVLVLYLFSQRDYYRSTTS
ncbi:MULTISPECIES: hypothetical protein [unclassified Haladaptatus]|uniref:hypothetical protein n=1 Tax=unclassified Haladaptatus TaxID=2622732 RepID=UPI00209C0677|nr:MULTISPECIES: hypothetical protein [unclassified Haladaptatus]MCO8247029.1 hypothetical protein [Haladaptatus sp. AB643]MCO8254587.1 hypothetical protein [Haladaptatus sp. AB618]